VRRLEQTWIEDVLGVKGWRRRRREVIPIPGTGPTAPGSRTTASESAVAGCIGCLGEVTKVGLSGTTTSRESTFVGHDDRRRAVVFVVYDVCLVEAEKVNMWTGRLRRIRRCGAFGVIREISRLIWTRTRFLATWRIA
jgi:hypothetical protein